MRSAEQKYREENEDNAKEVAYAVNNGQLSVRDLSADFDKSLLTDAKQAEFAEVWETKEETAPAETKKPKTK